VYVDAIHGGSRGGYSANTTGSDMYFYKINSRSGEETSEKTKKL